MKFTRWVGSVVIIAVLAGCVTTSDSRFAREADEEKAVRDYVQLATAYVSQSNYDRARMHLDRALEINAESPAALSVLGLIYEREGESELAEQAFRDALAEEPLYTRGRVFYAAFLYGEGRYDAARNEFAKAAADSGYADRGSVFYNLGRTEQRLGNAEAAAAAFERAVRLGRSDLRALLALSTALVEAGKVDEAAFHYDRLNTMIARNPQIDHTPESLYTGLRIARHRGDQNRAASLALLLRNKYPNSEQYQKYKALMSDGK
ncbi:MAG: tetratricopeptide repeat protein [Oleiphilaceae bacterium]|nr:tetratricopeptide repeat protein [Oleiphilaceae bacterium]